MADSLAQLWASFPDEMATAKRLAFEQAASFRMLGSLRNSTLETPKSALAARATECRTEGSPSRKTDDDLSIAGIHAGYAARTRDPVALLERLLTRIDAVDRQLNTFVALDRAGAIAAARASVARWASGTTLGPLDGVPVGVKDVIDVAGLPTRCHSRLTSDAAAAFDAPVVARLRAAGAVILGKLATHEFAIGGPAFDLPFPPARNPWNLDHHPGGSSSGAGAAVAAGLVPLAIGTDTAGSIRNPASACGVVGLKPGRDVLSVKGVEPLAPSLDHVGMITRTVADMAFVAGALGIATEPRSIGRVGYVRHFHTRDMTGTPEVSAALDRAAAALDATEITLPPLGSFALVNRIILQAEGWIAQGHRFRDHPQDLSYLTRAALLPGAFSTPETLALALAAKERLTEAVQIAFAGVDILLTASSMEPPCRIDNKAEIARSYMLQARTPFNVTGHPALAMGAGLSWDGLPLSLQFAVPMGEERRLLAAASAWEAAMGGPMRPPSYPVAEIRTRERP